MKHYLVAGGAGFIGSHLVARLTKEGNKVTIVDNLSTGSITNIASFKKASFVEADICDYQDSNHYDFIINLACPASPVAYQATPIQTMLTNVQGTYNLLCMAHMKKARFLQASTSEVYGDPNVHPQTEVYWGNVNCYGPRSCYDEGKRAAESLVYDFQRVVGLDARIVRIFNTYGPNMAINDGRVVSNFIVQALEDKPISIYGDGSQSRSFCYVSDTVEAITRVLDGEYTGPINVGNPNEFTMLELAQAVLAATESTKSKLQYFTLPEDDPKQRCPDITLMKEMYMWKPKVDLESGLEKTIKYFKKALKEQK
jgi:UDP-glucuronate decarboxylase